MMDHALAMHQQDSNPEPPMPIHELKTTGIQNLTRTTFASEGIKERTDLQRLLRDQVNLLADNIMVIAEEFHDWADSNRSIDLLCLDTDANLIVLELKRTADGGHMELQALRYAAMVSTMTFDQAVAAHARYLQGRQIDRHAHTTILDFLGWDEPDEERFGTDVKIILVSEGFSREITTAVMWLNERDLDIRCVRLTPYNDSGRILLDIQQVIPLPEAADYQVRIKEKEQRKRSSAWQPKTIQAIWREFEARTTPEELAIAKDVYAWMEDQFDEVFPTANAFAPMLHNKSRNRFFLKVTYLGTIEIWFTHLAKNQPFAEESLREELRNKLNHIPGIDIPSDRLSGKPHFQLSVLANDKAIRDFKSILIWMKDLAVHEPNA
jgi:hypothetical protein